MVEASWLFIGGCIGFALCELMSFRLVRGQHDLLVKQVALIAKLKAELKKTT